MTDNLNDPLAIWQAYCDKKMELEDAQDRIEALEAALQIADTACSNYWGWEFGDLDIPDASLLVAWHHNWNERTSNEH